MSVLIPFLVLAVGTAVVMTLLYRNLVRLDEEAGGAWQRVQEGRTELLEAAEALLRAASGATERPEGTDAEVRRAIAACRAADDSDEAATADTQLANAWHSLAAATPAAAATVPAAARERLQNAEERLLVLERLYNNSAITYNNAGVTFPALLVAKRARYAARAPYRPKHLSDRRGRASSADAESLAEKSPRIMNAYMLWAVGMSDTVMEEADR